MSELHLNTTLLTNMEVLNCLSQKGGKSVYLMKSSKSDQLYVLKHISVPESQTQVEALIFTGAAADTEAAQHYYQQVVSDYQTELEQMETLANSPNLDCFHSYEIKPKEDGIGFDVFLMAEYRRTLTRAMEDGTITHAGAVNMAMDLCGALQTLRSADLIHRDVTPNNIYLNDQGHYMIGDLGTARISELKFCSMPEALLSSYSAPELFELIADVNETVDLYSVGLILYRIYNGNHAPFEDEKTTAKAADRMRITGQPLPTPMFADYEMAEIICKTCAFRPEDRYPSPEALRDALVDYMKRNQVGDTPIVPPITADAVQVDADAAEEEIEPVQFSNSEDLDEDFKTNFAPDNDMLTALIESVHRDLGDIPDDDKASPEEAAERMEATLQQARSRKSRNKWLPTILVILILLALTAAGIWFFILKPDIVTIDSMEVVDQTVDSLTVSISTQEDPSQFEVVCADAYGTEIRQPYTGQPNAFTGLAPGSQYTISLVPLKNVEFEGAFSITGSTKSTTNVISFTVNRQTVNEMELSFVVDGNEPEEWTVSYGPSGGQQQVKAFTGHTVLLSGLAADTQYDITLLEPVNIHLSGQTAVTGRTLPSVSMGKLNAVISSSTATLSWSYTGQAPESWNVTTTGTDGYTDTQTVSDSVVVLENLVAGETYSIMITCDNMEQAASAEITPNALRITDLKAAVTENGSAQITWTAEAKSKDIQWLVVTRLKGSSFPDTAEQTAETSFTLSGVIPNSTYIIEIQEASGKPVGGDQTQIELTVPAPEAYRSNGFTKGYVSTWLRPTKEEWTVNNLSTLRTTFGKDEIVAFACESIAAPGDSDEAVQVLLVVRNSQGAVVDYYTGEEIWNDMWIRKMYVGELARTPQEPGVYTLEIYFDGKLVRTDKPTEFTIAS